MRSQLWSLQSLCCKNRLQQYLHSYGMYELCHSLWCKLSSAIDLKIVPHSAKPFWIHLKTVGSGSIFIVSILTGFFNWSTMSFRRFFGRGEKVRRFWNEDKPNWFISSSLILIFLDKFVFSLVLSSCTVMMPLKTSERAFWNFEAVLGLSCCDDLATEFWSEADRGNKKKQRDQPSPLLSKF